MHLKAIFFDVDPRPQPQWRLAAAAVQKRPWVEESSWRKNTRRRLAFENERRKSFHHQAALPSTSFIKLNLSAPLHMHEGGRRNGPVETLVYGYMEDLD